MNPEQTLEMASLTDTGKVRSHNEDSLAADASLGLAIIADGMGGHRAGEIASGMATALIVDEMKHAQVSPLSSGNEPQTGRTAAQQLLRDHIAKANSAIYQLSGTQPQYAGMGTTLVAALFQRDKMTVAHIGDARFYRLRNEELQRLTKDHSLVQEQLDMGMITPGDAEHSANKNLVMRALGVGATVEPELHDYDTLPGDIYLLCSDGLSDMAGDDEIASLLRRYGENLESCAQQLVQAANDHGGRDNISVILVRILPPHGVVAKVFEWLK